MAGFKLFPGLSAKDKQVYLLKPKAFFMERKQYNSLDLCKLLMAFCVVAQHTLLFTDSLICNIYYAIIRMAVPFFFLTSGFLLAQKMEPPCTEQESQTMLRKFLAKICKMYFIWSFIYLPLAIYHYVMTDIGVFKSIIRYIRDFVFLGEHWNSWQLWYLLSMIYALFFIIVLSRIKCTRFFIVSVGFLSFLIGIGLTSLSRYYGDLPECVQVLRQFSRTPIVGGICRAVSGMFYLPLGLLLFQAKIKKEIFLLMFFVALSFNVLDGGFIFKEILRIFLSIGFFGMAKAVSLPDHPGYLFARKMSIIIYLIHMYVFVFCCKLTVGKIAYGVRPFLATLAISSLIAALYIVIRNRSFMRSQQG